MECGKFVLETESLIKPYCLRIIHPTSYTDCGRAMGREYRHLLMPVVDGEASLRHLSSYFFVTFTELSPVALPAV